MSNGVDGEWASLVADREKVTAAYCKARAQPCSTWISELRFANLAVLLGLR